MSELTSLSASQMAEQIRNRKISPVELVDAHLARIEKLNPKINAFVQLDGEHALKQARDAEGAALRNHDLGRLHGVPITSRAQLMSRECAVKRAQDSAPVISPKAMLL